MGLLRAPGVQGHTYFVFADIQYQSSQDSFSAISREIRNKVNSLDYILLRRDEPIRSESSAWGSGSLDDQYPSHVYFQWIFEPSRPETIVDVQAILSALSGFKVRAQALEIRQVRSLRVMNSVSFLNEDKPVSDVEIEFGQRIYPNLTARQLHSQEVRSALSNSNSEVFFEFFARLLGLSPTDARSRQVFRDAKEIVVRDEIVGAIDNHGILHRSPGPTRGSGWFRDCTQIGNAPNGRCL